MWVSECTERPAIMRDGFNPRTPTGGREGDLTPLSCPLISTRVLWFKGLCVQACTDAHMNLEINLIPVYSCSPCRASPLQALLSNLYCDPFHFSILSLLASF